MATFKKFEEIESWQKARELTRRVYEVSNKSKFSKDFGLKDQIRRAAVSVMVEGDVRQCSFCNLHRSDHRKYAEW